MRRLGFAIVTAALFASTSAYAQIVGDIGTTPTGSRVNTDTGGFDYKNPPPAGPLAGTGTAGPGHYQTVVDVGDVISFKAANATTNSGVGTNGTTTVGFGFNNPLPSAATFESTIIAAGMGFQVVAPGGGRVGCEFWQCSPVDSVEDSFASFVSFTPETTFTLGQVGFNFDISDNGNSIYNVSGEFNLLYGPDGLFFETSSLYGDGSAADLLNGFHMVGDRERSIGFEWDETAVEFDLFGPTHNLVYTTSVFSYSATSCIRDGALCLVAYSGFGDPIGRGGGVDAALRVAGFDLFADGDDSAIPGGAVFNRPVYDADTNTLRFASVNANSAVPEPGAWALMILGFGAVGAAMRRRRVVLA